LNRLTDHFLLNGEYLVTGRMLEQQLASASRARELVSMHLRCKDWRCPGEIFYRHKLKHLGAWVVFADKCPDLSAGTFSICIRPLSLPQKLLLLKKPRRLAATTSLSASFRVHHLSFASILQSAKRRQGTSEVRVDVLCDAFCF
jgi:hypothetical protein